MPDPAGENLNFDSLPDLPQIRPLLEIAPRLWERPEVAALWIGGSVARGDADRYSDVDLRVAVRAQAFEAWKQADVQTLMGNDVVAQTRMDFGEHAFLHHVILTTGDIYDIWIQSETGAIGGDTILVLGCRDASLSRNLRACRPNAPLAEPPPDPEEVRQLLVEFWVNTHKHRKVLDRGLHLLCMTGIQTERALLLRLWYIEATGRDAGGQNTQTIHGLTRRMQTVEQAKGAIALPVLGACLASRADIVTAIELLRDHVAQTGRLLAERLGFAYPDLAEAVVRRGWEEFRSGTRGSDVTV